MAEMRRGGRGGDRPWLMGRMEQAKNCTSGSLGPDIPSSSLRPPYVTHSYEQSAVEAASGVS